MLPLGPASFRGLDLDRPRKRDGVVLLESRSDAETVRAAFKEIPRDILFGLPKVEVASGKR